MQKQETYWLLVKCQMIEKASKTQRPLSQQVQTDSHTYSFKFCYKRPIRVPNMFLWRLQKSFLNRYVLLFRSILTPQLNMRRIRQIAMFVLQGRFCG